MGMATVQWFVKETERGARVLVNEKDNGLIASISNFICLFILLAVVVTLLLAVYFFNAFVILFFLV